MFSKSPTSPSEQDPLRKQALKLSFLIHIFIISLVLSAIPPLSENRVLLYSKECQSLGVCQAFLVVCTHITQATASSKHTARDLFPRMLQTPPFQVNTTTHYPKFSCLDTRSHHQESQFHCHQTEIKCTMKNVLETAPRHTRLKKATTHNVAKVLPTEEPAIFTRAAINSVHCSNLSGP